MQIITEAVPNPNLIMFLLLLSIFIILLAARSAVSAICRIARADIDSM
jgi:hypothetical protein